MLKNKFKKALKTEKTKLQTFKKLYSQLFKIQSILIAKIQDNKTIINKLYTIYINISKYQYTCFTRASTFQQATKNLRRSIVQKIIERSLIKTIYAQINV